MHSWKRKIIFVCPARTGNIKDIFFMISFCSLQYHLIFIIYFYLYIFSWLRQAGTKRFFSTSLQSGHKRRPFESRLHLSGLSSSASYAGQVPKPLMVSVLRLAKRIEPSIINHSSNNKYPSIHFFTKKHSGWANGGLPLINANVMK